MFDLGVQELIVIFVVALIVFGPRRLPELGRTIGKVASDMKKALNEVKSQVNTGLDDSSEDDGERRDEKRADNKGPGDV